MNRSKVMLASLLGFAVIAMAACAPTGGEGLSGAAVQPSPMALGSSGETAGAASLGAALEGMDAKARVDLAALEKACGKSAQCLQELEAFKAKLAEVCPAAAGCADQVAMLLYEKRSSQQVSAGIYPTNYPQVDQVAEVVTALTGQEVNVGGSGGSSGGSQPGTGSGGSQAGAGASAGAAASAYDTLVASVSQSGGEVKLDDIILIAKAGDASTAAEVTDAIQTELKTVPADSPNKVTAQTLVDGGAVSVSDAVQLLTEIKDDVVQRVEKEQGSGSTMGGGNAALAAVVQDLQSGGGTMTDWEQVAKLLGQADPSLPGDVKDALAKVPATSPAYASAEALLEGKSIASTDAAAALEAASAYLN
jgi:hypothetical protein